MVKSRLKTLVWFPIVFLALCVAVTDASIAIMAVDLGSQFLKIGLLKPGIPMEVILNKDSQRKTPSVIAFHNGERFFGEEALQMSYKHPERAISFFRDLIGIPFYDSIVNYYRRQHPYLNITEDPDCGTPIINTPNSGSFGIETLVAMLLAYAREQAVAYGNAPVYDVVITIPPYFTSGQKKAVIRAAEISGLNLRQLMGDNSAAALNYAYNRRKELSESGQHILIYDIGASNTVATIVLLKLAPSNETFATHPVGILKGVGYNRAFGGHNMSLKLRDLLAQEFMKQHATTKNITKDPRAMAKLLKEAERVKHILSINNAEFARVENLFENKDFGYTVTRDVIEGWLDDLRAEYMDPIDESLKNASLNTDQIDAVVLFGAGTRMPGIQKALKDRFNGKEISWFLNTDEAATLGALFQGAHLSNGFVVSNIEIYGLVPDYDEEVIEDECFDTSEPKKILAMFERIEKFKARRDAAQNALETQVYDVREKINNEEFLNFTGVQNLTELVNATSIWLEEEVVAVTTAEEFYGKKAAIDKLLAEAVKEATPSTLDEIVNTVEQCSVSDWFALLIFG